MYTNTNRNTHLSRVWHNRFIPAFAFLISALLNPVFAQDSTTDSVNNEQLQSKEEKINTSNSDLLFNPQPPIELIQLG